MKRVCALVLVLISTKAFSQDSLQKFSRSRNHITATGMKVLGSWGIVNAIGGTAGWAASENGSHKYFYQMNTLWGAVNAGIAVLGLAGTQRNLRKQLSASENLQTQRAIEKTFLLNGGLDFGYIGTGIYLNSQGNKKNDDRLKGYGSSVIMQGAFLLMFDAVMYSAQRSNGHRFKGFLNKNAITFTGSSIGVVHHLY